MIFELLALVLFLSNTANFRYMRTSRQKVHAHRRELSYVCYVTRSLGGNLKERHS